MADTGQGPGRAGDGEVSYIKRTGHRFPAYEAWDGTEDEYPDNRLIGVFYTLRGARRACDPKHWMPPHEKRPTVWRGQP